MSCLLFLEEIPPLEALVDGVSGLIEEREGTGIMDKIFLTNQKKPLRLIVLVVAFVALVAAFGIGFAGNRTIDRSFPMKDRNLADLQTDAIIIHIMQVTGAKDDAILVAIDNFQLQVSGNFDWKDSATISMFVSKNRNGGAPYFACQLRIFPDEHNLWVTKPRQQEQPQSQSDLRYYLDALKYLPQEHIKSLAEVNPDMYLINLTDGCVPSDNQPCVFYNRDGLTENGSWNIRLDVQPLYQNENGSGYHGFGSDLIHVFYADTSFFVSNQTYSLENSTERQKLEHLSSVTLYSDGTALLLTPPISSYALPKCTYAFAGDELLIYASIETEESENAFGVKNGEIIARFTVANDNTLVFQSASVPVFAEKGARYVSD